MAVVDLNKIGLTTDDRLEAVMWLYHTHGPNNKGIWRIQGLSKIVFEKDDVATYFIMRFS